MDQLNLNGLHDDLEPWAPATSSPAISHQPSEPAPSELDFCSACKKKNCPKFRSLADGRLEITDTDFPGVAITLQPEQVTELRSWLAARFG